MYDLSDVTVVIPQRNRTELTRSCVESLRRWEGTACSILVVDDGSQPDSVKQLHDGEAINCRVIHQSPRGVTAAWNTGLNAVDTSWIVLLNNDVLVHGPFLQRLLKPIQMRSSILSGVAWRYEPLIPIGMNNRLPQQRLLAGWCLGFAKETWHRLGGFDDSMRMYFSDTDFQLRAARLMSLDDPRAILSTVVDLPIVHLGHQTTRHDPERTHHWREDRATFLAKWSRGSVCEGILECGIRKNG